MPFSGAPKVHRFCVPACALSRAPRALGSAPKAEFIAYYAQRSGVYRFCDTALTKRPRALLPARALSCAPSACPSSRVREAEFIAHLASAASSVTQFIVSATREFPNLGTAFTTPLPIPPSKPQAFAWQLRHLELIVSVTNLSFL